MKLYDRKSSVPLSPGNRSVHVIMSLNLYLLKNPYQAVYFDSITFNVIYLSKHEHLESKAIYKHRFNAYKRFEYFSEYTIGRLSYKTKKKLYNFILISLYFVDYMLF